MIADGVLFRKTREKALAYIVEAIVNESSWNATTWNVAVLAKSASLSATTPLHVFP